MGNQDSHATTPSPFLDAGATALDASSVMPVFTRYRPMRAEDWNWVVWSDSRVVPIAGPLDGAAPADVETEIALASGAGLDGFLMEFGILDGLPQRREVLEEGFFHAANRGKVTIAALYAGSDPGELAALAQYVAANWAAAPEYWHCGGKPCVVWDDATGWDALVARTLPGRDECVVSMTQFVPLSAFFRVPVTDNGFEERLRIAAASAKSAGRPVLVESWNFAPEGSGAALLPTMSRHSRDLAACWRAFGDRVVNRVPMCGMWRFWDSSSPHAGAFDYPAPDETLRYGSAARQTIDLWRPSEPRCPLPVAIFIHGGGWNIGSPYTGVNENLGKCLSRGLAFAIVSYRLIEDADRDGISPPVWYPLEDALAAVRFVRKHAPALGLNPKRIALFGDSAGACSSLYVALQNDCELGIRAIFADAPQTSMDPAEVVGWIPNQNYGGNAFGYPDFKSFLAERDKWAEWIGRYSPAALVRRCTPSRVPQVFYHSNPLPPDVELPKDPAHAAMYCVKFREICDSLGIGDRFRPGSLEDALDAVAGHFSALGLQVLGQAAGTALGAIAAESGDSTARRTSAIR